MTELNLRYGIVMDDNEIEMNADIMFANKVRDTLERENFKDKKINNKFIFYFDEYIENLGVHDYEKLMMSYNSIVKAYKEWKIKYIAEIANG